jgi:uncharacterized membrane protein YeiH
VTGGQSTTLVVIDLVGIFVFAMSGGLVAVRKGLDIFGVLVLAATTGLGGGFIRDVLIGAAPPESLRNWPFLLVPVAGGLLTFWFHPAVARQERVINIIDAVGLALFSVAGAEKALDYGLNPLAAALMGMVTAIGGGMLRDVLAGRVPLVLRPGVLYAIPSLAGAAVAAFGIDWGAPSLLMSILGGTVCLVWRLLAIRRRWQAPIPQGSASV